VEAPFSSPEGPSRRSRRWASRAGGALIVSALAHTIAAAAVGAVLRSTPAALSPEPEVVDVDVAPLLDAPAGPMPDVAAPRAIREEATARQAAHARRTRASTTKDRPADAAPLAVSASAEPAVPTLFVLSAGTVASRPAPAPAGAPAAPGTTADRSAGEAVPEREVNVPARLLSSSPLVYPPAARQAEIETDLPVEIVVDTEGRVASARSLTRAGYGLDEAALAAIRTYRFSPAVRAGRAVRVRMRWLVQFRLR
jgi:periplasmic protein TonB